MHTTVELTMNSPEGIVAGEQCAELSIDTLFLCTSFLFFLSIPGPKSEENFFEWEALIS